MSRLIDVDKLIEDLEKVKKESESLVDILHIIGFQSVIDAQPTAYDVEKVVEQLEDELRYISLIEGLNYMEFKEAIDVVKAGGIDGN